MEKGNSIFSKSRLKENQIPIGAYCSPQPAFTKDGIKYPSMINVKTYRYLADLGIDLVYGHNEIFGRSEKDDKDVFDALACCEKVGIKYLVNDFHFMEYCALGFDDEYSDWRTLSVEKKKDLDDRFRQSLRRVKDEKAFAGIFFIDEPGMDSFDGMSAAKKVFDEECPGKMFNVNLFPGEANPWQYHFGWVKAGAEKIEIIDGAKYNPENNNDHSERYQYYFKEYVSKVKPDFYSYDAYPFLNFDGSESLVFKSLYFHLQFGVWVEKTYGIPFWPMIQVGGKWERSAAVRITDFADIQLYMNLALAYGAKGLTLFPTCHPNDWTPDDMAYVGVLDRNGEPTDMYYHYLYAIKQLRACEKYLVDAKFQCAVIGGKFIDPLTDFDALSDENSPLVFKGDFPAFNNPVRESYKELKKVNATSQFFVGCFNYKEKSLFYVVNNSVVTAGNVELVFDTELKFGLVYKGKETEINGSSVSLKKVGAGEGFLLYVKGE